MHTTTREQLIATHDIWQQLLRDRKSLEDELASLHKVALAQIGLRKFELLGMTGYLARLPAVAAVYDELQGKLVAVSLQENEAKKNYLLTGAWCLDTPKAGSLRLKLHESYHGAYRSTMRGMKYIEVLAAWHAKLATSYDLQVEHTAEEAHTEVWVYVDHQVDVHLLLSKEPGRDKFIDFCLWRHINPMVFDSNVTYEDYRKGLQRRVQSKRYLRRIAAKKPLGIELDVDRATLPQSLFHPERTVEYYPIGSLVSARGREWTVRGWSNLNALELEPTENAEQDGTSFVCLDLESVTHIKKDERTKTP